MILDAQIKLRYDTSANWSSNNPTLASGEVGVQTDGDFKIGDGTSDWGSLNMAGGPVALSGKETAFSKNTAFNKNFGSSAGTVCQGNDSRLSDARTPVSHDNTYHSTAYEAAFSKNTAFNKNFGTGGTDVCVGNDSRLSDARTPASHDNTYHITNYAADADVLKKDGSVALTDDWDVGNHQISVGGGLVVSGGTAITGGATIIGDLTVSGIQFATQHETVEIADNLLLINDGEVGSGVTASGLIAGIEVDRGSATNYRFVFDETSDNFRVGEIGDLQAVATREDSPISGGVATWNDSEYRFDTSSTNTAFNKNFGSSAGDVCQGNDSRLSDARTPTSHDNTYHSTNYLANISEDTTPQLGGDLDTNQKNIELQPIPTNNNEANGITATMTVDANTVGFGAALHMDTDGNWVMADADWTSMPCQALALEAGTGSKKVLMQGFIRNDSWNWTVGGDSGLIYVSTTTGQLTQTAPSSTGDKVQIVGFATHADRMYFNPEYTLIEVA
jgi:hypothetical protein